jgi:hypothetical protein
MSSDLQKSNQLRWVKLGKLYMIRGYLKHFRTYTDMNEAVIEDMVQEIDQEVTRINTDYEQNKDRILLARNIKL